MRLLDLVGHKYEYLEVIGSTDDRDKGSPLWLCRCVCGVEKYLSTRRLRSKTNPVKSCGCQWQPKKAARSTWTGYGEIPGRWWSHSCDIAASAKRRNISKTLTIEQAWDLFLQQDRRCIYTGIELTISSNSADNTASIDRIDSAKVYDLDNVQWVHKTINMMKNSLSHGDFIKFCIMVSENVP